MRTSAPPLGPRLVALLPELSPKRQRLARAILDEPFTVAFATAEDLGRQLDLDRATVVRFSRALGFAGFSELKEALRADLPHFLTATEKLRRRLLDRAGEPSSFEGVLLQEIRNIQAATAINAASEIEQIARSLAGSERVLVLGFGISSPLCQLLVLLLRTLGVRAAHEPDEVLAAAEVAAVDTKTAVVAITFWRFVRSTARLFEIAADRAGVTVAITDSESALVARRARHTLIAPSDAEAINNSLTAGTALVNALVTAVASERSRDAYARSRDIDSVFAAAGVTVDG
ncbi:MAG: MurR/RpiR family transcriptional regulator [Candidatus Dormiibacterota bacterium]